MSKKEYKDYGEYLEDAYEEMAERSARYGQPSNMVTVRKKKGTLEAEWNKRKV